VTKKNEEITQKLRLIKDKANTLSGDLPNEMILQVFVTELAAKVEQRKLELSEVLRQAKEVMEYEKKMAENISQVGQQIDRALLEDVLNFLREFKPRVERLSSSIK